MLRHLDAKLASGAIDQYTYDVRKAETHELIRRGRAVEYSRVEAIWRAGLAVALIVAGVWLGGIAGGNGAIPGLQIGVGGVVWGVLTWRKLNAGVVRWRG